MQLVAAAVYYLPTASEFSTCCSALLYILGAAGNKVLLYIWLNINDAILCCISAARSLTCSYFKVSFSVAVLS